MGHCELDHCCLDGRAGWAGAGAGQVTPAGASSSGPHGVRGQGNTAGTVVTEDAASRICFFLVVFVLCLQVRPIYWVRGRARCRAPAAAGSKVTNVFFS